MHMSLWGTAELMSSAWISGLMVPAELFVSVGSWSFIAVPEIFIFSKKDAAIPQMRLRCGSCSEHKTVRNTAVRALALVFLASALAVRLVAQ